MTSNPGSSVRCVALDCSQGDSQLALTCTEGSGEISLWSGATVDRVTKFSNGSDSAVSAVLVCPAYQKKIISICKSGQLDFISLETLKIDGTT